MTRVLSNETVAAFIERRNILRNELINDVRETLRRWAKQAEGLDPFEHGVFWMQVHHEINTVKIEMGDGRQFARRNRAKVKSAQRKRVFERDGFKCLGCGWQADPDDALHPRNNRTGIYLTVDHKIPSCEGGTTHIDNLRSLCNRCNHNRGCEVAA